MKFLFEKVSVNIPINFLLQIFLSAGILKQCMSSTGSRICSGDKIFVRVSFIQHMDQLFLVKFFDGIPFWRSFANRNPNEPVCHRLKNNRKSGISANIIPCCTLVVHVLSLQIIPSLKNLLTFVKGKVCKENLDRYLDVWQFFPFPLRLFLFPHNKKKSSFYRRPSLFPLKKFKCRYLRQ